MAGRGNTSYDYTAADELISCDGSTTGIDVKTFWEIAGGASSSVQSCG